MSEPQYTGKATDFYLTSPETADMVNLAVALNRPLLVEGEPGCGKTRLAYSIAEELRLGAVIKIAVKSTSRAQELLYRVNVLRRLQAAQRRDDEDAKFVFPYISLGPLGQAIYKQQRCVVLIDEIDKADIDFPNDLLDVLDQFSFQIEDLPPEEEELCQKRHGFGRTIGGLHETAPVVVITSNREKRLPEPFLRRCLYLRLAFPRTLEDLRSIVRLNTKLTPQQLDEEMLGAALAAFQKVRGTAVAGNLQKPPSTGELIDWVHILYWKGEALPHLARDPYFPPYWETLFKTMNDLEAYPNLARASQTQV